MPFICTTRHVLVHFQILWQKKKDENQQFGGGQQQEEGTVPVPTIQLPK